MTRHLRRAALLTIGLFLPSAAQAQDTAVPAAPTVVDTAAPTWKVAIRPYFFLAGVSGSVTSGSNTIPINSTFGDILDNVKLSLFTSIALEKGRWGVYGDFQYIDLNAEGSGAVGGTVGLRNIIGEIDGTYRPRRTEGLRLVAGVRGYQVDQTVTIGANPPVKAKTLVIDPIIGAVGVWRLGDQWQFRLRGDIGGFGVSSEFTSQLSLVVLYDISKVVSIPLGYRTLNYRIKTDGIHMDTGMGGLVVGVDIRP